jgi:hypothetical protein
VKHPVRRAVASGEGAGSRAGHRGGEVSKAALEREGVSSVGAASLGQAVEFTAQDFAHASLVDRGGCQGRRGLGRGAVFQCRREGLWRGRGGRGGGRGFDGDCLDRGAWDAPVAHQPDKSDKKDEDAEECGNEPKGFAWH